MRTGCRTGRGQIVDTSLFEAALQQTYWHAASYFATGRIAGPARLGAHPHRALPGVRGERRLDQHRRREPGELGAHRRRARPSRVAQRRALRDQFGAHATSRSARRGDERRAAHPHARRVDDGVRCSRRSRRPRAFARRGARASADASSRHGRRSRASRGRPDARRSGAPSISRIRPHRSAARRPASASTRVKYCVPQVLPTTRSKHSSRRALSPSGGELRVGSC